MCVKINTWCIHIYEYKYMYVDAALNIIKLYRIIFDSCQGGSSTRKTGFQFWTAGFSFVSPRSVCVPRHGKTAFSKKRSWKMVVARYLPLMQYVVTGMSSSKILLRFLSQTFWICRAKSCFCSELATLWDSIPIQEIKNGFENQGHWRNTPNQLKQKYGILHHLNVPSAKIWSLSVLILS